MKQIVGVIESEDGHPVREDPLGTEAEIQAGPYLLSDGVSLGAPIPIKIVTGNSYVDIAGNLRGVWPMNISGLVSGPILRIAPTLTTDTVYVGTTVGVSTGVWDGVPPITFTYQWQMSNGAAFTDIPGAIASTYTATAGVVGYQLRAKVTATDVNGSTVTYSVATSAVTAPVAPTNSTAPSVTGTARVGQSLSGSNGTWTGTPTPTYTRQWMRNGTAISGATGATYALVAADAGATISLRVTATNSAGSATATSAATAAVTMAPANTVAPAVSGDLTVGSVLTTTNGTWSGTPTPAISRAWQWSVNGTSGWTNIPGQIGPTYTTTEDDADYYVRCLVTATNSAGTASTASNVVGPIVEPSVNWDWQPFTVRTGDSGAWIGFSNGDIVSPPFNPPVGTITNEPTAITQLEAIFQDASGDIVAVLQGDWQAYVSSVTMAFDAELLTYQGYSLQGGNTFMRFSGFSETVAVDTDYTVEFG